MTILGPITLRCLVSVYLAHSCLPGLSPSPVPRGIAETAWKASAAFQATLTYPIIGERQENL